jgi:NAD(P) transhydrogenase subunit beta
VSDKLKIPFPKIVNLVMLIACIVLGVMLMGSQNVGIFIVVLLVFVSMIYGITFVMPIGGGDMPVVISLLNSLSGIAAAISGLLLDSFCFKCFL